MERLPSGDVVVVPIAARPGWAPAWGDLALGETRRRSVDFAQWAQVSGLTVADVSVRIDPLLTLATPPAVTDDVITFDLAANADAAPGAELAVAIFLTFVEDAAAERVIVVRQPIRAGVPANLVPAGRVSGLGPAVLQDAGGALVDAGGVVTTAPPSSSGAVTVGALDPSLLQDAGGTIADADGLLTNDP